MGPTISKLILKWWGWRLLPEQPVIPSKYVIIAIPHTSNWDFPVGLLVRSALSMKVYFAGKNSLFKPPFGWLFRALGGVPINRSKRSKLVDAIAQLYEDREQFAICIAPEGTRSKVNTLKSGFYYIALQAKIPIIMIQFNWADKKIVLSDPFYPSGNKEEDFAIINNYFKGIKGKNPEWSYDPASTS
jgi:1-acyl-sn-glycerol-3-phosphate acyltransferase